VQTEEELEVAIQGSGYESWEWQPNGDLKTVTVAQPSLAFDPRTGRTLFFNAVVAAYVGWEDSRNDPKKSVVLGNGVALDDAVMMDVDRFMTERRVAFPWEVSPNSAILFCFKYGKISNIHDSNPDPRRTTCS
jgi:hypothetical protein